MKKITLILMIAILGVIMNSCVFHKGGKVPPGQLKKYTGVHPSKSNPGKGNKHNSK